MKKGYTIPTQKKIKSVLRSRSKTFLINLIMGMFSKLTKTAKISFLIKIDRRQVKRKARKVKRRSTRKGQVRKTARRAYKPKRRGKGFQGKPRGSKAEKMAIKKAQRARKGR